MSSAFVFVYRALQAPPEYVPETQFKHILVPIDLSGVKKKSYMTLLKVVMYKKKGAPVAAPRFERRYVEDVLSR